MNIRTKTRATAIVIRDGHALLIHRKNEKEYFVFPGGGVEKGETPERAVIREVMEETSIEVRLVKLLESKLYDDGSENISLVNLGSRMIRQREWR
ncbi:MAG: NUDIX domain-containing protein [Candidatus Taylorbacteria bacterium]